MLWPVCSDQMLEAPRHNAPACRERAEHQPWKRGPPRGPGPRRHPPRGEMMERWPTAGSGPCGWDHQDLEVPHPAPAVLSGACSPESTVLRRCRTPSPSKEDGKTRHRHPRTTLDGWKQPLHSRKLLCTHILKKKQLGERKQNIIFFCIIHAPRHFMHQAGVDNLT